jgi:hypothetical protein
MFTTFAAGPAGDWQVTWQRTLCGAPLPGASYISVARRPYFVTSAVVMPAEQWRLIGVPSHIRYAERLERERLARVQAGLGRAEAKCAALIPIRKSEAWWALSQDERREIFEARSHHIEGSMKFLPAIARQLYHARDLGQPFDFLTWFEFAPEDTTRFDELVAFLRTTPEWSFVEREVDIRLSAIPAPPI